MAQIDEKTVRLDARTKTAKSFAEKSDTARRLQTMPGAGPLTARAVEAFAPDMATFRRGRDVSAWLWLVPRQHSLGGKERLGRVSKAGQADIRRLLVIGAMPRLNWLWRRSIPEGSWLARMAGEKTSDAGRDRARQPDGPRDLGHVHEEGELSGSGVDHCRMSKTAKAVPRR